MKVIFIFTTVLEIIEMVFSYRKVRKIFTVHNVFFFGVVLNFCLYLLNWSSAFVIECQPITYIVIVGSQIVVTLFDLIYIKRSIKNKNHQPISLDLYIKRIGFGGLKFYASTIIFLGCLACSVIENVTTYGTPVPFLSNIDSHKNSIAFYGTIWRSAYPIGLFAFYFEYRQYGGKRLYSYIILIITVLYLLIGGGSRFWSFISIMSFAVFFFINIKKKINIRTSLLFFILAVVFLRVLLLMGMTRLQADYPYKDLISYTGPFVDKPIGDAISWFYGYFPYSFYNLNLTLLNIQEHSIYTYGQFFILPFLYLTKLYKFTNLDYTELALSVRVITNTSATVATAFFEFYSDFRMLFWIPMVFYVAIMHKLQMKRTLFSQGAYSYCLVCFFLFNFYNVFSPGIPYTFLLLWFVFNKIFVYRKNRVS